VRSRVRILRLRAAPIESIFLCMRAAHFARVNDDVRLLLFDIVNVQKQDDTSCNRPRFSGMRSGSVVRLSIFRIGP
jgi:hypothetical protein